MNPEQQNQPLELLSALAQQAIPSKEALQSLASPEVTWVLQAKPNPQTSLLYIRAAARHLPSDKDHTAAIDVPSILPGILPTFKPVPVMSSVPIVAAVRKNKETVSVLYANEPDCS